MESKFFTYGCKRKQYVSLHRLKNISYTFIHIASATKKRTSNNIKQKLYVKQYFRLFFAVLFLSNVEQENKFVIISLFCFKFSDSPGVPPSATAHELFRGFSYVAPGLLVDGNISNASTDTIVASMTSANNNGDLSSIAVSHI